MKRGRPVTRPTLYCQHCGTGFRGKANNANKFCSHPCATASRPDLHPPEFIARARELWDAGHSVREIARQMGVSHQTISGINWRNNFPARPSPIRRAA